MRWITVVPYEIEADAGIWQFELSSLVPVSAMRLTNADDIVYYDGVVSSQVHNNPKPVAREQTKSGRKKLRSGRSAIARLT